MKSHPFAVPEVTTKLSSGERRLHPRALHSGNVAPRKVQKEFIYSLLALVPALALFMLFTYYPLLSSVLYAFTDWNGYSKHFNFVGLTNFLTVFQDPDNRNALWNTCYIAGLSLLIGLPLQFLLAILLSSKLKGSSVFRAIIYIPTLLSPVIVALTWSSLLQYSGIINTFWQSVGLKNLVIDWLGNVNVVKLTIVLVNQWEYTGMGMVVLLAGISSIPPEIQEAARIDGAIGFRRFWNVTLPLMMPAVTVNLFFGITGALKLFDLSFLLTNGGPRNASTTATLAIYNNAFGFQLFGLSSAMGLVFFAFIAVVSLTQLFATRRRETEF